MRPKVVEARGGLANILAQRAWAKERPQRCCEHGPRAVVGGMEQKVLPHFRCSPHLQGNSCQEPHPMVSQPTDGSALTGFLSPL